MYDESVKLFSATYLHLYLAGKSKTQQNCKQTVRHLPWWLERSHHTPEWNHWCVQRPEKKSHFDTGLRSIDRNNYCLIIIAHLSPGVKMGGSDFLARGAWKFKEITCNSYFSNLTTVVTCLSYYKYSVVTSSNFFLPSHRVLWLTNSLFSRIGISFTHTVATPVYLQCL